MATPYRDPANYSYSWQRDPDSIAKLTERMDEIEEEGIEPEPIPEDDIDKMWEDS